MLAQKLIIKKLAILQQKTINTLNEASRVLFDSIQKFVKSQSDFFQEQAQVAANVATNVMSNTTPEENIDYAYKVCSALF